MFSIDWIVVGFLAAAAGLGLLSRRAPRRFRYFDEEGDGVSARTVCGWSALICLVIAAAQLVRCLGPGSS